MKERLRITLPHRLTELTGLVESVLLDPKAVGCNPIHTYPYLAVAQRIARALIRMERGAPRLLVRDDGREQRFIRLVDDEHSIFDREHLWQDRYSHDRAARAVVAAILTREVRR